MMCRSDALRHGYDQPDSFKKIGREWLGTYLCRVIHFAHDALRTTRAIAVYLARQKKGGSLNPLPKRSGHPG
jgi:hypothetical protein